VDRPAVTGLTLSNRNGLNEADMSYAQAPIGSGFGARTTARQILAGRDLRGKLAVVTGGYSGLGLEATRALAESGAEVVVPARRSNAAREALAGVPGVEVDELDLADLESVRAFAERVLASRRHIDIVICNAGIMACPETRVGPGWEAQFATNHLGHYALVNHLWPALAGRAGARVVALSSGAHRMTGIRWDDLNFARGYDRWQAYGQSKCANVLFAVQLDTLGKGSGVRAFAVHPGSILTPLQRHLSKEEMVAAGWIDENGALADPTFKTPAQGAATGVWAATSPQLNGLGGLYCVDCDIAPVATETSDGVAPHAIDPEQAARLWALSVELTHVSAFSQGVLG
jgi:NAD(P)-dependent dehydrogenase (short-subunit alcohol dehydrogenase family)